MQLQVVGYTWQGFESAYSYTVPDEITTDAQAQRAAGDFARVTDWQLVATERSWSMGKRWRQETVRHTVLRPWRDLASAGKFAIAEVGL